MVDLDFEAMTAQCEACKITTAMPTQHLTTHGNTRVLPGREYTLIMGTDFLVLVDAFSKWPEVKVVSSTTTQKTINLLSEIFATHGFPRVLVSDNGPKFTSTEFEEFLQQKDLIHY